MRGAECDLRRVHRQDAIAQRVRGEELAVQLERRSDFREGGIAMSGVESGARGLQPRLKSLPAFPCVHACRGAR